MSDFNKIMTKEMIKMGINCKIIPRNTIGNVSPIIEWIKWLSYEPEFEKKRIEYLDSKKSELSYEEIEEVTNYNRNKIFAGLFMVYGTSECSQEDYMRVYDYMCNESIEELMLKKLTSEELKYAREEITRLNKISKEQLSVKVKYEQIREKYEQLSMVDSYILHIISDINYVRSLPDLNKKIEAQLEQNDVMRQRSLYYASNPYAEK
mgnify:CR=1 FL=1